MKIFSNEIEISEVTKNEINEYIEFSSSVKSSMKNPEWFVNFLKIYDYLTIL